MGCMVLAFQRTEGRAMADKIVRFPKTTWERIKNRRGENAVSCIVTGRYLRFGKSVDSQMKEGVVLKIEVMTDTDSETPDRKMCELIVPLADLKKVIELSETPSAGKE